MDNAFPGQDKELSSVKLDLLLGHCSSYTERNLRDLYVSLVTDSAEFLCAYQPFIPIPSFLYGVIPIYSHSAWLSFALLYPRRSEEQ